MCHRRRYLFLDTPKLWALAIAGWDMHSVKHLLKHVSSQPLHLIVNIRSYIEDVMQLCLPGAGTLRIDVVDPEDQWTEDLLSEEMLQILKETRVPHMHKIIIRDDANEDGSLAGDFLHPGSYVTLTSVTLVGVDLESALPPLPALQTLDIDRCLGLIGLHQCLSGSGLIERLKLHLIGHWIDHDDDELSVLPKLSLPNLRHLEIQDDLESLVQIFTMLPDLRESFHIITDRSQRKQTWSSSNGPNGFVVSRLERFWSAHAQGQSFPAVH